MIPELISSIAFFVMLMGYNCNHISFSDPLERSHGQIIFVSMMFRHGNRTIFFPYPTDPYQNLSLWPEGFGQLTKAGKRRAFQLGKWTRKRYDHLIVGKPYSEELLSMNSTNLARALMSAELFLAGFYPPSDEEMWSEHDFPWQPIPVHPVPPFMDNVLATEASCQKYNLEVNILSNSLQYANLYEQYRDLFEHVSKHSGRPMGKDNVFLAIQNMINVYTCLNIEENRGLLLPSWAKSVYPEPMKTIADLSFVAYTETSEMKRLIGGPILKLLIADMERKRNDDLFKRIFQFYSGHDTTITALLNTLSIFNGFQPPYSSAVIVELRKKSNQHIVTVFYKNSTEADPYLLKIPACGDPCILDAFIENTKQLIPGNWEDECSTL